MGPMRMGGRGVRNRGHLKDEVMVYEMLVRIFRSPELIVRLTEHRPDYHCVKRCCEEVIWDVCCEECESLVIDYEITIHVANTIHLTIDEDHFGSDSHASNTVGRSQRCNPTYGRVAQTCL